MSDDQRIAALVGGPGIHNLPDGALEEVDEWVRQAHYKTHEVTLIFAGEGPRWVLCLDCDWSADVPEGVDCP